MFQPGNKYFSTNRFSKELGAVVWKQESRFINIIINLLLGACIATGYGLDDRGVGVQVPVGVRI
jgi:hypothetical protein